MRAFVRRARIASRAAVPLLVLMPASWPVAQAAADHGAPSRAAPLHPAVVGVLAGALTLAAGLLVLVIAMRLTRRPPPAGKGDPEQAAGATSD